MNDTAIEQQIQAKGLTAPRVTLADLNANIIDTEIVKHISRTGQVFRWAIITVINGFGVVGKPSVAVSPENDDAEIGERCAVENSRDDMWPLMGYALKNDLHRRAVFDASPKVGFGPGNAAVPPVDNDHVAPGVEQFSTADIVGLSKRPKAIVSYSKTTGLSFGMAISMLKDGLKVARAGWNGKGMFVYLVPAASYVAQSGAAQAFFGHDSLVPYNAYMALKGADDTVSTWAPSGSDALADDWHLVE